MKNLIKKIQDTAHRYTLWQKGSKIVVGVSGGPDSVCLLDILVKLAPKYDFKLVIAHINYNLRGRDSQKDEEFVHKLAEKYNLKAFFLNPRFKNNSEENLRNIRYAFFEKLRKNNDFDSIALAHNLDDQAETYLMRIIRGAGLCGMAAMKYKNEKIIRPLLGLSRQEILEYLKVNKLKYRIDKSNKDEKYLRNKIRHGLIPYLEKNFNPAIKKTIFSSAVTLSEDYDLISKISKEAYQKNKGLNIKKILGSHPALQKRILRQALEKKKGNLKDIENSHVEELVKALKSTKSKPKKLFFRGLKIMIKGGKVIISLKKR